MSDQQRAGDERVRVGDVLRYSGNGRLVTVEELLDNDRALVRWMTAGRKPPGRRYYTVSPAARRKVVRLGSLS